jgi:hypothetical protein
VSVWTIFGFANAGLNLAPICHGGHCSSRRTDRPMDESRSPAVC